MTPKQVLVAHIDELHRKKPPRGLTYAALGLWHARQHHQLWITSHRHEGLNLGPLCRPPGWRTGENVVDMKQ